MLLVKAYQIDASGGRKVGDGGGGSAGNDEGSVKLAVLETVGTVAEALVGGLYVVLGQTVGTEHVNGVKVNTGAGSADGNLFACKVGNGLYVGVGCDYLDLLHVESGNNGEALNLGVEQALAVIGIAHNVGLNESYLNIAGCQILDIGLGAVGGNSGNCNVGIAGDIGGEDSAEAVVGAGLAAGAEGESLGAAGAGAFLDGGYLNALFLKVFCSTEVIGNRGDGGSKL